MDKSVSLCSEIKGPHMCLSAVGIPADSANKPRAGRLATAGTGQG